MDFSNTPIYNQMFFEPDSNCYDSTSTYNTESLYTQNNTQCQSQQYYDNNEPLVLDDGIIFGNWEHSDLLQKQSSYQDYCGDMAPQYFNPDPSLNEYHDLYSPTFGSEASTDSSPFFEQRFLLPDPSSPVTPSDSPLNFNLPMPSMYLVDDNQYNYDAYHVPIMPEYTPDCYLGFLAPQESLSPFTSPESLPSLSVSPAATCEDISDSEVEQEDDERSVLPNCGNTELRGMGLYDDKPDRMYASSSLFSPNTHKSTGKGLVLEQSFGPPKQMTMSDEETEEDDESQLDSVPWQQPEQYEYQLTSYMY